jgi:hypothetical protein
MMSEQEAFDIVVRGLAAQGWERSADEHGDCAYRGLGGRKCAIGHLIPDDLYDGALEGNGISSVLSYRYGIREAIGSVSHLLEEMQGHHDHARSTVNMRERFKKLENKHGLQWPEDVE